MQNEVVITLNNISKQIGSKVIFSGLNFGIHAQDKIGVVGVNGCGKTTLLRLLTGLTAPSTGEIILRKGIKIGYLMQDIPLDEEQRLLEYIMPEQAVAAENDEEHRYKAILSTLGIDDYEKPLRLLSGGQRRKADLAKVLVQEPDVLILDEPTASMDAAAEAARFLCSVDHSPSRSARDCLALYLAWSDATHTNLRSTPPRLPWC